MENREMPLDKAVAHRRSEGYCDVYHQDVEVARQAEIAALLREPPELLSSFEQVAIGREKT